MMTVDTYISALCNGTPWTFTGASALVYYENLFWVEIGKRKHWRTVNGRITAPLGAIGGSLEIGESLIQALQRETIEEIGCSLHLASAKNTCSVYEHTQVSIARLSSRLAPIPGFLTISKNLYRQKSISSEILVIATYLAQADAKPVTRDLLGLLALPPASLVSILNHTACLGEIMAMPDVQIQMKEPLPKDLYLEPVWTMETIRKTLSCGAMSALAQCVHSI